MSRAEARAVEAAHWLDAAGLLADSPSRPGLPLRNMLRAGVIEGAQQRPGRPRGRWFIVRVYPLRRASARGPPTVNAE